ncbi:FAD:protein FMN transferase [Umezawaea sp. Da 62-37]|uniref:FAD:protein FMN transferase n=1 Tax=Umezawaea sp. Da 62-37 TaxID=3075927 RepID=UPI0028F74AB8|nr:FAD:protein FMN transferase [Umezawaea sp. Da 62-37]WNV81929.1 FAD:protein FMN transferase [Umezawaea sp. Da 62-37]
MPTGLRRVEQVMGLPVSVDLRDDDERAHHAVDHAFAWLHEVDLRFSPFRPDSEVSRHGRSELAPQDLSADLTHVIDLCDHYERSTGGAFTTRLPDHPFDPCAVVKGWAVQGAAEMLHDAGARRFCVNAGGDVVTAGEPEPDTPWRVGIRHPEQPDRLCAVLALNNGAVATSAAYERGAHIIDGRTGKPARGLLSITITAPDLTTADTVATAAYAMGQEGISWAAAQPNCEVFAVDSAHRVFRSPGLPIAT